MIIICDISNFVKNWIVSPFLNKNKSSRSHVFILKQPVYNWYALVELGCLFYDRCKRNWWVGFYLWRTETRYERKVETGTCCATQGMRSGEIEMNNIRLLEICFFLYWFDLIEFIMWMSLFLYSILLISWNFLNLDASEWKPNTRHYYVVR